ncbi:MAG TPA: hypothetical protein DD401_03180 [Prevotella sp.]|nr:hypothetical protein [Prevotella sp.]
MYKAEINMISTKLNSNNVRKTLPEKNKDEHAQYRQNFVFPFALTSIHRHLKEQPMERLMFNMGNM